MAFVMEPELQYYKVKFPKTLQDNLKKYIIDKAEIKDDLRPFLSKIFDYPAILHFQNDYAICKLDHVNLTFSSPAYQSDYIQAYL